MLKIVLVNREQLIDTLSKTKGKVDKDFYLISLNDRNEIPVIAEKDRVLSIDYPEERGPISIKNTDLFKIYQMTKQIEKEIKTSNKTLVIQCTDGKKRAYTIAIIVLEILNFENVDISLLPPEMELDYYVINKGLTMIFSYYWNNEFILPF